MQGYARRSVMLLAAGIALVASAGAAEKPYKPSWKYRTHNVSIDVQADGTTTTRREYAFVVLDESAREYIADQDISYHENNGVLEDVVAYTLKADGTKVPLPETNVQVTSHGGVNGAPPAFSDFKNRKLIFPNVEVGDTVVLAYTLRDEKPSFGGYFSLLTTFARGTAYDDAQLVVTAPRSLGLQYKSFNLPPPAAETIGSSRQRWTWTYRNPNPEDTRKDSGRFERAWRYADAPTIEISNFRDYGDVAAAYEREAARRAQVTERIRALASEITKDRGPPRERAEKLYAWTTKEISFAGNCLTGGDVVPRDTDLILNMKMGDCKDHATLMQALLAAQGIASTQVLVNAGGPGYEVPEIPCWQAFDHVINYVPELDLYFDATSPDTPFGLLPMQEQGKPVIRTSGYAGVQRAPMLGGDGEWTRSSDRLTIRADGGIDASANYRLAGTAAHTFSHRFAEWIKSPNFDDGAEVIRRAIEAHGYKGGGSYQNIEPTSGPADTFSYGVSYHVDDYLDMDSPFGITLAPFFPSPNSLSALVGYAAAEPFDHDFLCHGDRRTEELSVTFPSNLQLLALPKDVHAETALLRYDARYEHEGNTIRVTRTIVDASPGPVCVPEVSKQYQHIGAAIKKDLRAQAVYRPK